MKLGENLLNPFPLWQLTGTVMQAKRKMWAILTKSSSFFLSAFLCTFFANASLMNSILQLQVWEVTQWTKTFGIPKIIWFLTTNHLLLRSWLKRSKCILLNRLINWRPLPRCLSKFQIGLALLRWACQKRSILNQIALPPDEFVIVVLTLTLGGLVLLQLQFFFLWSI